MRRAHFPSFGLLFFSDPIPDESRAKYSIAYQQLTETWHVSLNSGDALGSKARFPSGCKDPVYFTKSEKEAHELWRCLFDLSFKLG